MFVSEMEILSLERYSEFVFSYIVSKWYRIMLKIIRMGFNVYIF